MKERGKRTNAPCSGEGQEESEYDEDGSEGDVRLSEDGHHTVQRCCPKELQGLAQCRRGQHVAH